MNDEERGTWKTMTYLVGAAAGLVMGLTAAHFYTKSAEESGEEGMPVRIEAGDAVKIGMASLALLRQISSLGSKKPEDYR